MVKISLNTLDLEKLRKRDEKEWEKFISQRGRFVKLLASIDGNKYKKDMSIYEEIYDDFIGKILTEGFSKENIGNLQGYFISAIRNKLSDFYKKKSKEKVIIDENLREISMETNPEDDEEEKEQQEKKQNKIIFVNDCIDMSNENSPLQLHHRLILNEIANGNNKDELIAKKFNETDEEMKEKIIWDKQKVKDHKHEAKKKIRNYYFNQTEK